MQGIDFKIDFTAKAALGEMYLLGKRGLKRDLKKAFALLDDAAFQYSEESQFFLAIMYWKGLGVGQNTAKAKQLLEISAYLGYKPAKQLLPRLRY